MFCLGSAGAGRKSVLQSDGGVRCAAAAAAQQRRAGAIPPLLVPTNWFPNEFHPGEKIKERKLRGNDPVPPSSSSLLLSYHTHLF